VRARRRGWARSRRRRGRAITLGVALVAFVLVGPPNLLHAISGPATPRVAHASDGRLSVYAEPDSAGPVLQVINGARHSLDMTMYELRDESVEHALAGAARRGVLVRVVLDRNLERARNQAAYAYLAAHGVHVVWAAARFAATHQKTVTADRQVSVVLTGSLVSSDYASTRDFAILDRRPADVAAIEQTFQADYTGTELSPTAGAGLVWSPTTSESELLAVIGAARHQLLLENEEMADAHVVSVLVSAARRHVAVTVVMTASPRWTAALARLRAAGARVALYADTAGVLYIHAKAVVADAGFTTPRMLIGSQNFSVSSLTRNRELGLIVTDPGLVSSVAKVITGDAERS
jgi:cardiolipin synthase